MARPLASISPRISVAWVADKLATSMWLVPAYRRVGPVLCGQQAISRTSKALAAAQPATSMRGVSGNGAVRKPSFIVAAPLRGGASATSNLHPCPRAGALQHRVPDEHLLVPVGERRVGGRLGRGAGEDVIVDRAEDR